MKTKITFFPVVMLVIANMIGMGVFVSLGFQAGDVGNPWWILGLWLVGGALSFCGALAYAALGRALPGSGGEFHFLNRLYGRLAGLWGGVISLLWGFAGPVAVAAMTADSLGRNVWPEAPERVIGMTMLLLVTLTHTFSVKTGARLHVVATIFKLGLIVFFIVWGLRGGVPLASLPQSAEQAIPWGNLAVSLIYVMYAYAGWNAAVYVMDEIHDARRTLPRAMLLGTAVVTGLYLLLYYVFLRSAPLSELAAAGPAAVDVSARSVFGQDGGRLMSALIMVGMLATMSAMTWAGPRVGRVMGEQHAAFSWLAKTSASGVPVGALWLQSGVAAALMCADKLRGILESVGVALTVCSLLTVAGVFFLRDSETRRPGVRIPAALFSVVLGATAAFFIWQKPLGNLLAIAGPLVVAFLLMLWGDRSGKACASV